MPREKKQVLKKRKDGRFACRYKDIWFYSTISSDDALAQRKAYREELKRGRVAVYFVQEYAENWFERAYPNISPSTKRGLKTHLEKLLKAIGEMPVAEVRPSDIKAV